MQGETYTHIIVTSYHCSPCKNKFACKKTLTKKDKQKREKENEHTENQKNEVECTRPFPRTQEEYKNFESKVSHINWQFELTKDEFLHSQVYVQLNTCMTMKVIKELFDDSSMFIEKIKTTSLLAKLYSGKIYNHCEKHKDSRWGRGKLSEEITGLFEFEEYKNEEYEAIVEGNKMLVNGATPLEVFKHNVEKVRYSHNYDGMKKIYEDLQQEKKKETRQFWRPVTFYLFGPGGSGKTGLVQELFSDELYDKPKKQRSGSNWWNGYEGQEIVLIDEFYTKIDWGDMINILNDSCFNVEKKHSGFEPFIAKYVFLTATKPPEEAYNFNQTGVTEDDNKRDYEQFDRQLDYIIEFQGKWHDDISQ
ncbi:hypothetical protein C2G38_2168352 [Gigaspora rosea]|uniref:Helicase superfamily 3 single-stranded DNA/RNA virus domain-containing protein n=1 Tax=Gigaspora rosea TaxID=44941 RepID=A0A397VX00_9GLOM|nr:hypothetical protein C2G38_2168352 [Gigaspora rosea]